MRRDELEFIALSPTTRGGAFVTYPQVFDLENPEGYYQRIVEQRLQEKAQRALWDAAHSRGTAKRGFGWKQDSSNQATGSDQKAGAPNAADAKGSTPAAKKAAQPPGAEVRNLYPAGKPLAAAEVVTSRELAPTDTKGRIKCWDVASHKGCSRTAAECFRSHLEPIKQADSLHWTVQAQLLRRGGLRHHPRVEPQDVDAKVQALRNAHRQDEGAKKAEGVERAKNAAQRKCAGSDCAISDSTQERAGETKPCRPITELQPIVEDLGAPGMSETPPWVAPSEFKEAELTQAEEDLRLWCKGPEGSWIE
eukprot:3006515-Amphidinium_carterae.2